MDLYSLLREIADSWGLLALFTFFVGAAVYIFRPGASALHDEAAQLAFNDHQAPKVSVGCANACPGCTCAGAALDFTRKDAK
ncbi:cytochrome c oxidase cbb3-type subunit 4 [Jannaschia faecimaris]|uniref:Cytochrome c oxidase cbb3-type subunit 4 n=1 Tax=Jannaschia faecimaris TaxID=1244108 RepID=A0A1H3U5T5_9RHOB|nr:cbb3-type cytochrome c oxidase subunit 3 [Jannaschia faecimaris]SDZ57698.1 cytochrome c oxidase cbb3-type subunit 4 [Jannaschia faecimaris]